MARITLDDLVVSSFFTETGPALYGEKICTADISTCPRTSPEGGCLCTADISTCPRTTEPVFCVCTADISTCSRTSPQGGCDTSVQCVTG